MTKKEVQKRVLKNGEPLPLKDFEWDEKTKKFSSKENGLVLDFTNISGCTFTTGSGCTFKTGSGCTFKTGWDCTFTTGWDCTFTTGSGCTFKTGSGCTFKTDSDCTFTTGWDCTFTTGSDCTFKTGWDCTFTTGWDCTFTTGSDCTFTTGSGCTFTTGSGCTFKTGWGCTFTTGWDCTFTTRWDCVLVRRDVFEIVQPKPDEVIQFCPNGIAGYLVNGMKEGVPHIIADGILSRIINQKGAVYGAVYKVINHGEERESFLLKSGVFWSHGSTMKEARDGLLFKLSDRDTTAYKGLALDTVKTPMEWAVVYHVITGACESGCRNFMSRQTLKKNYTLAEIIAATEGQYNCAEFKDFFKGE